MASQESGEPHDAMRVSPTIIHAYPAPARNPAGGVRVLREGTKRAWAARA
jgi:hypothetical protein